MPTQVELEQVGQYGISIGRVKWRIALIPLELLRPHEQVDRRYLKCLREVILRDGVLIKPLIVDARTLIILDGHHRYEILRSLGKRYAPAVLVDYDDDKLVTVSSWRPGWNVTKEMVRKAGLSGRLLPPRTSRHRLSFRVPCLNIPLDKL